LGIQKYQETKGAEGMLTDDMTRLCGEIHAMRRVRASMMSELQHGAKRLEHTVTNQE
jgi:hypothetical protein